MGILREEARARERLGVSVRRRLREERGSEGRKGLKRKGLRKEKRSGLERKGLSRGEGSEGAGPVKDGTQIGRRLKEGKGLIKGGAPMRRRPRERRGVSSAGAPVRTHLDGDCAQVTVGSVQHGPLGDKHLLLGWEVV